MAKGIGVTLLFCVFALTMVAQEKKNFRPVFIAHRGASGYLPEHTLEATVMAHGLGADFIEQDVVLSKDDVPMVLHDIHLDDVSDVKTRFPGRARKDEQFYVIDFTLAELKTLQMKERFKPATGERVYPGRYAGGGPVFRIATLEEALQLIAGLNASTGREAGIYPEIKQPAWHHAEGRDLSAVVLPLLKRFGYAEKSDKCYLQCFEFPEIKRIREELGYKGRLIMLMGGGQKPAAVAQRSPEGLRELAMYVDGIGPPISEIVTGTSPSDIAITALVHHAHDAGLIVHPYSARADELPKWATSYGELLRVLFDDAKVDGLFTDFPGRSR